MKSDDPRETNDEPDDSEEREKAEIVSTILKRLPDEPVEPTKLAEIIGELVQEVVSVEVRSSRSYRGPLPSPETLAEFKAVDETLVERIVARFEAEGEHRHEMDREVARLEHRKLTHSAIQSYLGQVFAFIVAMTAIGGGIYLVASGMEGVGIASIVTALAALVVAFIAGKVTSPKPMPEGE